MLAVSQKSNEDVLGGQLFFVSRVQFNKPSFLSTYVNVQDLSHEKTGKDQAVADFLHENTSRSKSRRSHIRTAVVVDNDSDNDVNNRGGSLADQNRACVETRVLHLRCDGKIGWNASVTENQRCHSRHGLGKGRRAHDLPVRGPGTLGRSIGRAILNASGNRESEDY